MKKLILLLAMCLLVGTVNANAFSAWSSASGCWTATNDTYTLVMWNATGTSNFTMPSGVTTISKYLVVAGGGGGTLAANHPACPSIGTVEDAITVAGDVHISAAMAGAPITGTASPVVLFKVQRIASSGTETTSDARLLGVSIKYIRTVV